jgi:hypothetical protein
MFDSLHMRDTSPASRGRSRNCGYSTPHPCPPPPPPPPPMASRDPTPAGWEWDLRVPPRTTPWDAATESGDSDGRASWYVRGLNEYDRPATFIEKEKARDRSRSRPPAGSWRDV